MSRLEIAVVLGVDPTLDHFFSGRERVRPVQIRIGGDVDCETLESYMAFQRGQFVRRRLVPDDVQTDMQHALAHPVGQGGKVQVGSDVSAPAAGPKRLQHRGLDGRRRALCQFHQLGV